METRHGIRIFFVNEKVGFFYRITVHGYFVMIDIDHLPAKRYYPFYKVKSRLVRMLEYDDVTTLWRACLVVA